METQEISQQITPGRKVFTFSRDEIKEILLKVALEELKQSEPSLTAEEMYHRVTVNVREGHMDQEWAMVLSVLDPRKEKSSV